VVRKITARPQIPDYIFPDNLQKIAEELGAWGSFSDVLRQSLFSNGAPEPGGILAEQQTWLNLPSYCCQAAGGDPEMAMEVNAAWGMLYTAAHTMDAIQDHDDPDAWWVDLGPPAAINIATSLYAGSGLFLLELFHQGIAHETALDILHQFQHTILNMCAGQHLELSQKELSLEDYWRIAQAKSGSFFSLACYAGARLASDDPAKLTCFKDFGNFLGIMIQISDDAKDIWGLAKNGNSSLSNPLCLLPVIFALSVLSREECDTLRNTLQKPVEDPDEFDAIRIQLEETGAGLYLVTKLEEHRIQAIQSLERLNLQAALYNRLVHLLDQLSYLGPAN